MSKLRVLLKPRAAVVLVLILIGMIAALVYALSSSDEPIHSQATDRQRIESDDPLVQRTGSWTTQTAPEASGGTYLYTSGSQDDVLTLTFSGNYIEVVFVSGPNLAMLALDVDNTVRRTVVTAADESHYNQQAILDYLETGPHTLRVYAQEGGLIAVDAFVVGITEPDEVSNLPQMTPTLSEMDATQTMDALLATVDKNKLGDEVIAAAQQSGEVWASVKLVDPQDVSFSAETLDEWAASISQIQAQVLNDIEGRNFRDVQLLSHVSGISLKCDLETLIALQSHPLVEKIQLVREGTVGVAEPHTKMDMFLDEAHTVLQDNILRMRYGIKGDDIVIAVLDTGIDLAHPALSDDIILLQACFNQLPPDCPPNNTTTGTSAAIEITENMSHGTQVTGIITANGGTYNSVAIADGIAPNVKIVAVRVANSSGVVYDTDLAAGLNWLISYQTILNVDFINMSLGSGPYVGFNENNCNLLENSQVLAAVQGLYTLGVRLFAATGNNGITGQVLTPACDSRVFGVGATYDSDLGNEPDSGLYPSGACFDATTSTTTITCFTNRSNELDYLAPGARIQSTAQGGGVNSEADLSGVGTSFASPMVASVAAIVEEINPGIAAGSVPGLNFQTALGNGGTTLTYPGTTYDGILVNALDAARRYLPDEPAGAPANDERLTAQTIPALPYKRIQDVYQSNYNAATDPNPASNGCFVQGYRNSVWYMYESVTKSFQFLLPAALMIQESWFILIPAAILSLKPVLRMVIFVAPQAPALSLLPKPN